MKIKLETENYSATIETSYNNLNAYDVLHDLIIPAMISIGYNKNSIIEAMIEMDDNNDI